MAPQTRGSVISDSLIVGDPCRVFPLNPGCMHMLEHTDHSWSYQSVVGHHRR